ncbi:hypothetical protein [Actinophytocola sp.]|uniref:hypothetical protein n=1 Tax=Actinophytocola sp. TaxID=1872138 RepID=UPI002ED17957
MSDRSQGRGMWLAVVILGAVLGAVIIGGLFYMLGGSALVTLGATGAAFVGIFSLGLKVYEFLSP